MPDKKKKTAGRRPSREPSRRAAQREQSALSSTVEQLLFKRAQTALALGGISVATVQRMENAGLLDKVRPAGPNGMVFHRIEQVRELARRRTAEAS